jgi:hypothetical protein
MNFDLNTLDTFDFNSLQGTIDFIEFTREINSTDGSKHSREWWTISAYVHFKVINNSYKFPLSIRRGNGPKPDFWISFSSNATTIGIETTFCSEEKYEQAKKICENRNDGSYPINTSFMKNNLGNFNESSFQLPSQPLHGMPVYGNYPTIYTIDRIEKSIGKKIETYKAFKNKYTLVVYINLPSNAHIHDEKEFEICKALSSHKEWSETFTGIEIIWSKENVMKLNMQDKI